MRTSSSRTHEPTWRRRPRQWQRIGRSALSAALALLLLIGVPWLLLTTVGNPTAHWPDLVAGDLSNPVVLAALSCIAWILWAQFTVAFLVEFVSALRRTPMPARIPAVMASQQWLARALVNGVLLLLPVTISSVAPAGQALAMTAALPATAPTGSSAPAAERSAPSIASTTTMTIAAHDERTWWDLADRHLGDGAAWQELWTLNAGRVQPDGTTLTSELVMLRPGWTVLIPTSADSPASHAAEPAAAEPRDIVVQPGDTLSQIAADHDAGDWNALWQANADRPQPDGHTFTDPDLIEPGWVITLPALPGSAATPTGPTVTVTAGDTLSRIALDHGTTVDALLATNLGVIQPDGTTLTDPDDIHVGWQLRLPEASDAPAPPADTHPPAQTPPHDPAGTAGDDPAEVPGTSADTAPPSTDNPDAMPPGPDDTPLTPSPADPPVGTQVSEPGAHETGAAADRQAASGLPVAAFAGAGGLLAALTLAALVRHRRRQFRHRRPGHDLTATPDDLVTMERAVLTAGSAGTPDAQFLDAALHGLAHLADAAGTAPPDVAAAVMTDRTLTLLLHSPRLDTLGAWTGTPDGLRWTLLRTEPTGHHPERRDWLAPPYPTLVTVGCTPAGDHWMLDLERAGTLTVTGDRTRALALARYMAAELAHHTWSESVEVTMTGFGAELAALHPERLTHIQDPAVALARLRRQRQDAAEVMRSTRTDVLTGRSRGVAGDGWTPQVLLVAATDRTGQPAEPIANPADRSTVAVVVVGQQPGISAATGWNLRITDDGLLTIPALDVTVIAQQIPEDEATRLTRLLSFAADPAPAGDPHRPPTAGEAHRDDPALDGQEPARAGSLLAAPDSVYLAETATTAEDLRFLATAVRPQERQRAEADGDLDADVAAWHDPDTARPRISLFGGPEVRAGTSRFSAFNTEIAAYLATRPAGVGIDRYACDMWPDEPDVIAHTTVRSKVRTSLSQVRKLLGTDPLTGGDYLPRNTGKGAEYRLSPAVLVDADLFGRLRSRGRARGPAGLADLHAALELVVGPPLAARRPGGYGWLADTPVDHQLSAAVVDLAHVVATHHLAQGELEQAAAAAETALRAGTSEDTPLLDLVAVCHAQGQVAQADAYIRRIMANHGAAVEEDLPPRTYEVLLRRQWLPPAA